MNRLAADLGGTRSRFMLAVPGAPLKRVELAASDHDDIESAIATALAALGTEGAGLYVALAVAGPVRDGAADFTNLPWHVDASHVAARFGFSRVALLNDAEAAATAACVALPSDAVDVHVAARDTTARHALVTVGTGLGVAYWTGDGHVDASEAGHAGFAPASGWQAELHGALGHTDGTRVTWECVLSGAGLLAIDAVGRGRALAAPPDVAAAARADDRTAREAVSRFSELLGLFAGDIALAAPAPGGVLLVGGALAGLDPVFDTDAFNLGFLAGRRLRATLERVPVWRTTDGDLALHGGLAALSDA